MRVLAFLIFFNVSFVIFVHAFQARLFTGGFRVLQRFVVLGFVFGLSRSKGLHSETLQGCI